VTLGFQPQNGSTSSTIEPADRIHFVVGSTQQYTYTVPSFYLDYDESNNHLIGIGPTNTSIRITGFRWTTTADPVSFSETSMIGTDEHFKLSLSSNWIFQPGDIGGGTLLLPDGNRITTAFSITKIDAELKQNWIKLQATPGCTITLQIFDPLTSHTYVQEWHDLNENPRKYFLGGSLSIQSGNIITVTKSSPLLSTSLVASKTLPQLDVSASISRSEVRGHGQADSIAWLDVQDKKTLPPRSSLRRPVTVGGDGSFVLLLAPSERFHAGDWISMVDDFDSSLTVRSKLVIIPYAQISLYGWSILGRVRAGGIVTATLTKLGSLERVAAYGVASDNGEFSLWYTGHTGTPTPAAWIEPGDKLELETTEGDPITLVVPYLTVHTDMDQDRIWGDAPAGSNVKVTIVQGAPTTERITAADGDGVYSVGLSDIIDLRRPEDPMRVTDKHLEQAGGVVITTPQEFEFWTSWCSSPILFDLGKQSDRFSVTGYGAPGRVVSLTLYSKAGKFLGHSSSRILTDGAVTQPGDVFARTLIGQDIVGTNIPILEGDKATFSIGDDTYTLSVPHFTGIIDPQLDLIFGNTAPNTELKIFIQYYPNLTKSFKTTTSNTGDFKLDLTGQFDIVSGMWAYIYWTNQEGDLVLTNLNALGADVNTSNGVVTANWYPKTPVLISLYRDGGLFYQQNAYTELDGTLIVPLGHRTSPILPRPSDKVVIESSKPQLIMPVTIPLMTFVPDIQRRVLRGQINGTPQRLSFRGKHPLPFWSAVDDFDPLQDKVIPQSDGSFSFSAPKGSWDV
jgi:hypothetical protein